MTLVLAGAAVTALCSGLVAGIVLLNDQALDTLRFWQVGSLAGRSDVLAIIWPFICAGTVLAVCRGPPGTQRRLVLPAADTPGPHDQRPRRLRPRRRRHRQRRTSLTVTLNPACVPARPLPKGSPGNWSGWDYCQAAHTLSARRVGLDDEQILAIRAGDVDFDDKLEAISAVAREAAARTGNVPTKPGFRGIRPHRGKAVVVSALLPGPREVR